MFVKERDISSSLVASRWGKLEGSNVTYKLAPVATVAVATVPVSSASFSDVFLAMLRFLYPTLTFLPEVVNSALAVRSCEHNRAISGGWITSKNFARAFEDSTGTTLPSGEVTARPSSWHGYAKYHHIKTVPCRSPSMKLSDFNFSNDRTYDHGLCLLLL